MTHTYPDGESLMVNCSVVIHHQYYFIDSDAPLIGIFHWIIS